MVEGNNYGYFGEKRGGRLIGTSWNNFGTTFEQPFLKDKEVEKERREEKEMFKCSI